MNAITTCCLFRQDKTNNAGYQCKTNIITLISLLTSTELQATEYGFESNSFMKETLIFLHIQSVSVRHTVQTHPLLDYILPIFVI